MNKGVVIALVVILLAGGITYWLYLDRQAMSGQPEVSNVSEGQPTQAGEPLGQNFTLGVGDVKRVDGMQIVFEGVEQDSRCPVDVQCIQAGSVVLRFKAEDEIIMLELPGSAKTANALVVGSYIITLVAVDPSEKRSTVNVDPLDYKATLRVEVLDSKG